MSVKIPYVFEEAPEYGAVEQVSPLIRRVTAKNPSAFTFHGTGTYIVGHGKVAVIDPGPLMDAHVDALLKAVEGEEVTHILITHTHNDHSPAAAPLKKKTGAPTYGFGPHGSGKESVEEGGDMAFVPDVTIRHGDRIQGDGWTFECVHTPGHTSNHMCFALLEEKALFTGDHVMGWSTSIVSPPDGDMRAYMDSLDLLLQRADEIYWPTHGAPIRDPKPFVRAFVEHRLDRERQIMDQIDAGHSKIADMVPVMYAAVDPKLYPAAARSVLAHVVRMVEDGRLKTDSGEATQNASYSRA